MEILHNFRLVLEGKTGKEIPESLRLEFLETFLAKNFALSDAEDNTSSPLNRGGIADLPLIFYQTISNLPKTLRAKFLGKDGPFCFSSICKFGSFMNPFTMITSLSRLYFRFRRFIMLVRMKKMISMSYGSRTRSWKPWKWVRFDLILIMRVIHINSNLEQFTKFTSSSRSSEFKDILPWKMSQMITKTISISTRIVKSYAMKRGILFWVYWKVNGNWDNNMIRISKWSKSHCRRNTSIRRNK